MGWQTAGILLMGIGACQLVYNLRHPPKEKAAAVRQRRFIGMACSGGLFLLGTLLTGNPKTNGLLLSLWGGGAVLLLLTQWWIHRH